MRPWISLPFCCRTHNEPQSRKDSCGAPNALYKSPAECSTSDAAMSEPRQPIERTPKGRTRLLAVCTTPRQLKYSVALALQQHGQQSTLHKGRV
jgi:hypothetical protein